MTHFTPARFWPRIVALSVRYRRLAAGRPAPDLDGWTGRMTEQGAGGGRAGRNTEAITEGGRLAACLNELPHRK
jgi:hypothetical protein